MSIGRTLADARERAGLSVEQVAAATRIRRTLVEDIEADNFSRCGGDFYARGHIRNVANTVGIDSAPLLAEFDASRAVAAAPRASEVFESETAAKPERRGPNWSAAMAAALVLVVIYGVVQVATRGSGDEQGGTQAGRTSAPVDSVTASPTKTPSSAESSAVAQAPRRKVTVAARAKDRSWIQATGSNGRPLFEGIVVAGQVKTFTDKRRVNLVIGNAGALDLTVNGTHIGAPGRSGAVAHVQFGPQDPAAG